MNTTAKSWQLYYSIDLVKGVEKELIHRGLHQQKEVAINPPPENTPEEKLMYTTTESQESLLTANTISPFSFLRDTIQFDREKLTIIHRSSFRTADIMSVQISDIISVQGKVGPIFGSLVLSSRYFINSVQTVNFLRRKDVINFQRLIQGSIIANHENIDYSAIEKNQLVTLLTDLGQGGTT